MLHLLALELALLVPGAQLLEAQVPRVAPPSLRVGSAGVEGVRPLSSLSARADREVERLIAAASARVTAAVTMEDESAKRSTLVAAETFADSALSVQPTVEALYWYATARGLRADIEDGRDQMHLAAAVHEEAEAILEADPDHAGAHHLMGRLHAGVMRLGTVKRFLAVRVMGGGALSNATWASAERHFRTAMALEPDRVQHKLELATLLMDTDRPQEARPLLEDVLRARTCNAVVAYFQEKASVRLEELRRG